MDGGMAEGLEAPLLSNGGEKFPNENDVEECVYERLSIDNILAKYVGDFGLAQLVHFVVVSLAWCLEGLHSFVMIFADREPEWQCRPFVGSPPYSVSNSSVATGLMDMSCTPASSLCSMNPSLWEWVGGKGISTVSEWGLICGDEYKVGLAQAVFFVGAFMGAGIFGHFSDSRAGRKGALFLACASTGLAGLITASANNYWVYVGCRWLTGFTAAGIGLSSFVLATEPVGPSKRGQVGMSAFYFFSLGIMSLPLLAYFSTSWRHLYIITSLPALVYSTLILPSVYESPRWFVVQGRLKEAMDVLRAFAKRNGTLIPEGVTLEVENEEDETVVSDLESREESRTVKAASGSLLMVLKNPATRSRLLIMWVIWFLTAIVYYGINLNVVNLGTNLYVGVFLNAMIEWPAFAITAVLLDRVGRRSMLASTMMLSGLCCLAGSFLFVETDEGIHSPLNGLTSHHMWTSWGALRLQLLTSAGAGIGVLKVLRILCSVVGIFGMAGTYNLVYIYTSELFPTVVRNAALGFTTQASGIGSIIAPFVVVAGRYHSALPFAIFGVMAIAGSALSLCLPETLNQPMFETLEGLDKGEKATRLNEST
ncbi:hypothetical protein KC19_8G185300 [Ceratodon purpureus]|uniref:Major facilitator superfamily (MFS) profile domain-containing protein n=1 Tax=Ceratodon purpureus TaxID=3225 RepID=A0A8T0H0E5_CERPU|nr:hypothetical protein KC19_8G185300 [Ceratodon purpureus]